MSIINARLRVESALDRESLALLRALLLCEVAEQMTHADTCRQAMDGLTGEHDSDSLLEREIAEVAAARADAAIDEARHALSKLEAGTYGLCERCDAALPFERLEAIPHARYCVACATAVG